MHPVLRGQSTCDFSGHRIPGAPALSGCNSIKIKITIVLTTWLENIQKDLINCLEIIKKVERLDKIAWKYQKYKLSKIEKYEL